MVVGGDVITLVTHGRTWWIVGDPHMCALVWDEGQDLLEAVRAVVRDAAAVFPAVPTPYLRMLSVFAHGPQAAAAAYQHLQVSA